MITNNIGALILLKKKSQNDGTKFNEYLNFFMNSVSLRAQFSEKMFFLRVPFLFFVLHCFANYEHFNCIIGMFEYFVVVFEQARNPGMVQKRIANSDELTGGLTDCRTDGLTD